MSAFESVSLETLTDSDAVSLLFELVGHGEESREKMLRLDAVVYARLAQAYATDELPVLRLVAA